MSHINKLTPNGTDLAAAYSQTKQLQKGMQQAVEKLTYTYQITLDNIKETTEQLVDFVRTWEQEVLNELDMVKDELAEQLNGRWKEFKDYGRKVRRSYLGEQVAQNMTTYPLHQVKEVIRSLNFKLMKFESVKDQHEQNCLQLQQKIKQLPVKFTSISQKKIQQKPDNLKVFQQISPIKPNLRFDDKSPPRAVDHGQSRFSSLEEQTQNEEEQSIVAKFKTQLMDKILQKEVRSVRKSPILLKQSRSTGFLHSLFSSPPQEINNPPKSPPLSKTGRNNQITPLQNHSKFLDPFTFEDKGKLKKFSNIKLQSQAELRISEDTFISSRPKNSSRQLHTIKGQTATNKGYQCCLQRLQKQQTEYEKIRRGLA